MQICQSNVNLPIHYQSTNHRPIQGISHSSMPAQPITNPPNQYLTNPPIFHQSTSPCPTHKVDQPCISNNSPNCVSGRHPICQSNVNPVSIIRQSEDNCPSNLGASVLYEPTEVSRRRTIQTIHFRRDATPAPIIFCHSANIDQSANPMSIRG